jgi:CubicO group peptidase (beta-lactamase class C family)
MARRGKLVAARSSGVARLAGAGQPAVAAGEHTRWLLYSQMEPVTSCAIWQLVERGRLRFHDPVAEYLPEFARHGKGAVTLYQLLSHQAGFPSATVPPASSCEKGALAVEAHRTRGGRGGGTRMLSVRMRPYRSAWSVAPILYILGVIAVSPR